MSSKTTRLIAIGGGFFAVLLGAFGAHALKNSVPPHLIETWKTANFYHFMHVVVLLAVAIRQQLDRSDLLSLQRVVGGFLLGMTLFSGSLYLYVITQIPLLAMITPIGGIILLLSWAYWFKVELTH